jgi:hypothetical protein
VVKMSAAVVTYLCQLDKMRGHSAFHAPANKPMFPHECVCMQDAVLDWVSWVVCCVVLWLAHHISPAPVTAM